MDLKSLWGFEGKTVVITGAASGMSKAAAELLLELGADVYALDLNEVTLPVKRSWRVDMSSKAAIDAVVAELPERIDALIQCHGMAGWEGQEVKVVTVNFVSQRYLAEALLPRIVDKGCVAFISSFGGHGWEMSWETVSQMLDTQGWDEAVAWLEANRESIFDPDSYSFSKKCLNGYVKAKCWAPEYIDRYIRINAVSPGLTRTGLTKDFEGAADEMTGGAGHDMIEDMFLSGWKGWYATSEEMGHPLVFLCSKMASYVSGENLRIAYGQDSAYDYYALQD